MWAMVWIPKPWSFSSPAAGHGGDPVYRLNGGGVRLY